MAETAGKVYPVHNNIFKFGTKGQESQDENMAMPSDLENFSPSIDGTVEEWYAMDAAGWAKAAMTGKKLSFSFKGKRSVGDVGNDYIAGLAWKFGQDVMTKFEWTMISGAKLSGIVVINRGKYCPGCAGCMKKRKADIHGGGNIIRRNEDGKKSRYYRQADL